MLNQIKKTIDQFSEILGLISAGLLILLVFNVFCNVIMRYVFNDVSIAFQELEWHLYATLFLLGISYAITHNSHVRVDIFYEKLTIKKQALIDLVGVLVFILPFATLVFYYALGFVFDSYLLREKSGDPGGLAYRWLIKSIIPLAFFSIIITSIAMLVNSIKILIQKEKN